MVLERRAHRRIYGIVGRDIGQRHAAYFGGKAWTQRDDVHRRILRGILDLPDFPPKPFPWQPRGRYALPIGMAALIAWTAFLFVLMILSRIEDRRRRRRFAPSLTRSPIRTTGSQAIKAALWASHM